MPFFIRTLIVSIQLVCAAAFSHGVVKLTLQPGACFLADHWGNSLNADLAVSLNTLWPVLPEDWKIGLSGGISYFSMPQLNNVRLFQERLGVMTAWSFYIPDTLMVIEPSLRLFGGYLDMASTTGSRQEAALIPQGMLTVNWEALPGVTAGLYTALTWAANGYYPWLDASIGASVGLELESASAANSRDTLAQELRTLMEGTGGESILLNSGDELKIRLSDGLFNPVEEKPSPLLAEKLKAMGSLLKKHPRVSLKIEGHWDETTRKSDSENNSRKRAAAVSTYLSAAGISFGRLNTSGLGSRNPLVPNTTPENRARNRRVELRFLWQ